MQHKSPMKCKLMSVYNVRIADEVINFLSKTYQHLIVHYFSVVHTAGQTNWTNTNCTRKNLVGRLCFSFSKILSNYQTVRLLKLAVKIFVAAERQLMCLNCDRCASNTKMTYWAHAYRFLVSLFDAMRRSIAIKWMDIYERSLDDKASLPYIFRMKSPNMFEMMIRWNINDSKFLIFLIFKS